MYRAAVTRRYSGEWWPEVALAQGPLGEAVLGDGSYSALYGTPWALIYQGDGMVLLRYNAGEWVEAPHSDALVSAPGLRHVQLAFDGSARPVVAWEANAGVYVRQWDAAVSAYVTEGPFSGHDPLLLADWIVHREMADGDVLLFHASEDRTELLLRLQRDRYDTPYLQHTGNELVLDQVVPVIWGWLVLGLDDGQPLRLRSGYYPLRYNDTHDRAAAVQPPELALIDRVVIVTGPTDTHDRAAAVQPPELALIDPTILQPGPVDTHDRAAAVQPPEVALIDLTILAPGPTDTHDRAAAVQPPEVALIDRVVIVTGPTDTHDRAAAVQPPEVALIDV